MQDAYVTAFYDIVKDAQEAYGYEVPEHLEQYIVMLLAIHVERIEFAPSTSFAEAYLSLKPPFTQNAKELGDACLFVTGVFPSFGHRKGLNKSYYSNIGRSSYNLVSDYLNGELFLDLSVHFDFLSDFIDLSIRTPAAKSLRNNLFR